MLCNDYRHASAPAHSESWGVVDVHVDIAGLAVIRPHRSSPEISLYIAGAAIAPPLVIFPSAKMLDSGRIVTPVA